MTGIHRRILFKIISDTVFKIILSLCLDTDIQIRIISLTTEYLKINLRHLVFNFHMIYVVRTVPYCF